MMGLHRSAADSCSLLVLVLDRAHGHLHLKQEVSTVPASHFLGPAELPGCPELISGKRQGYRLPCTGLSFFMEALCGGKDETTFRMSEGLFKDLSSTIPMWVRPEGKGRWGWRRPRRTFSCGSATGQRVATAVGP